jgi:hypothetical protein
MPLRWPTVCVDNNDLDNDKQVTGPRELVHDERESFIGGYKLAA